MSRYNLSLVREHLLNCRRGDERWVAFRRRKFHRLAAVPEVAQLRGLKKLEW